MPRRPRVAVFGEIQRVLVLPLSGFPRPAAAPQVIESSFRRAGGDAVETAAALVELGIPALVAGRVGKDSDGKALVSQIQRCGIETRAIQVDPLESTGLTIVAATPRDESRVIDIRGAERRFDRGGLRVALRGTQWVHLTGGVLTHPGWRRSLLETIRLAAAARIKTSAELPPTGELTLESELAEIWTLIGVLVADAQRLKRAAGERRISQAAQRFLDKGAGAIVARFPGGGSRVFGPGGSVGLPSVSEWTSRGRFSGFAAGYLCGLLKDASPPVAALLANACSVSTTSSTLPTPFSRRVAADTLERAADSSRLRRWRAPLREALGLLSPERLRGRSRRPKSARSRRLTGRVAERPRAEIT